MERYYVHGCRSNGEEIERCEDGDAQFWTLYARDSEGLSEGIIDCVFREDAVAAMAVYVERDRLNERVRALAAEGVNMRSIIDSITNLDNEPQFHEEGMGCGLEDRGITDRYEAMRHGWECAMERIYGEVIPRSEELDFPATDAILREVGARAVDDMATEFGQIAQTLKPNSVAYRAAKSAVFKCVASAARIRAGEVQP